MYKYYMGCKSNLSTKNKNTPTVIEVESYSAKIIQEWMDKYGIDFDELMDAVISITHSEIQKIMLEDTQFFRLILTNQQIAFLELLLLEKPKCKLCIEKNEYVFYIQNGILMEKCAQLINNIQFVADAIENKIMIGNKPTFISINLERFNTQLYSYVKKYIDELESWDMIAKVMEWIYLLPVDINSYDLTIVSMNERLMGMQKVCIDHNRIVRYVHINPLGEFQVDCDGTWKAEYNGCKFQYDLLYKKVHVTLPQGCIINAEKYYKYFTYVLELINIMLGTFKSINNGFERI